MQPKQNILCVDDDRDTCDLVEFVFRIIGFEIIACGTPEEAIRNAHTNNYATIITDFHLDGMNGTDFCRVVRTFDRNTPIIFLTGETRLEQKQAAMEAGAQAYFTKPVDFTQFEQTVLDLINKSVKV